MRTMTSMGRWGLLVAALAWTALPARAQVVDYASIRALEEEGRERAAEEGEFLHGAVLLRAAAELRGAEDPVSVKNLRDAGMFAYYGGDHEQAVKNLETAGKWASEQGAPFEALRAYLDGAWVAARAGKGRTALFLANRAGTITRQERFDPAAFPDLAIRLKEVQELVG